MSPILLLDEIRELPLATKRGRNIPNVQKMERNPQALIAARDLWTRKFPDIRARSLSATYNCGGMVAGFRRTCIESKDLGWILADDGYRQLLHRHEARPGDVVLYYANDDEEPTHISLILSVEPNLATGEPIICCVSQWGFDGGYFHKDNEVPAVYGTIRTYYSDRSEL